MRYRRHHRAGNVPFVNLSNIAGIGTNQNPGADHAGRSLGALASWTQAFNSAGGKTPTYIPGEPVQRTWRQHEYAGYFKDDWKLTRKVTLNLGVRYEYYILRMRRMERPRSR
jgi:outer membrane receptor protein involved in Fe transport